MALVGEAHIIVRAITTGVADDIKRGFNNIDDSVAGRAGRELGNSFFRGFNSSGSGNIFGRISDGLRTLVPDAEQAREQFRRLVKTGYYLQTGLSVLVGALAAVGGGIVALGGTAVAALPSFVSLANIMVGLRIGLGVAKLALGGVGEAVQQATQLTKQYGSVASAVARQIKQLAFDAEAASLNLRRAGLNLEQARENLLAAQQLPPNSRARREAELAYEEADLAYRRAQEADKEAQKAKKRGAAGGANDPFGNLTPSQRKFAEYLLTIQDRLKALKEAAASGFLPILQRQLERINTSYFPILVEGFQKIGEAVGGAVESITDMLTKSENISRIKTLFDDSAIIIGKVGDLLSGLFEGFLIAIGAAQPQAERFLDFLITKVTDFNNLLQSIDLEAYFARSGDIAADFGEVFGNVFDALGGIVEANFGPDSGGQYLLDWLKDATGQWAALNDTIAGKKSLETYFKGVAKNAKIIFQTIGKFFEELKGISTNPAIGETFTILQEAAPYIGDILRNSVEAGPAFAEFVVQIAKFLKLVSDSEAPKIFFETLTGALKQLNAVLETETGQKLLQFTGRIFAFTAAFGTIAKAISFFFKVIVGNVIAVFKPAGKFFDLFLPKGPGGKALTWAERFSGLWAKIGSVGKLLKIGGALTIALTLIIRFIELLQISQEFRDMLGQIGDSISNAFNKLMTSLGELWESIKVVFGIGQGTGGSDTGLMGILNAISDFVIYILVPVFGQLATAIIASITLITDLLGTLFNAFGPGLNQLFQGVIDLFQGKFESGMARIFGGIAIMLLGIVQFFVNGIIDVLNFFGTVIEGQIKNWGSIPFFGNLLKGVGLDPAKLTIPRIEKVEWTKDAARNIDQQFAEPASGVSIRQTEGNQGLSAVAGAASLGASMPSTFSPDQMSQLTQRDQDLINSMATGYNSGVTINMTVMATPEMDINELATEVSRRLAFTMRKGGK